MQVLRLNEVLTRVVAWHNRHPLARRIQASQVHSIGEVLLPFASAQPLVSAAPAAIATTTAPTTPTAQRSGETLADVVSARAAARPAAAAVAEALPGLEVHSLLPEEPTDPANATDAAVDLDLFAPPPAPESAPDSAPEPALEPGPEPGASDSEAGDGDPVDPATPAQTEPEAGPDIDPAAEAQAAAAPAEAALDSAGEAQAAAEVAPHDDSPGSDSANPLDEPAGFSAATADDDSFAPSPVAEPAHPDIDLSPPEAAAAAVPAPAPAPVPEPPPAPAALGWPATAPAGWLRRVWARLTGRRAGWPRLAAAFSRDFIWPLTPQAVARWAQRHGEIQSLAPTDWPRRQVAADPARLGPLRQSGLAHTVQLHVLTAAIGVGDRRIRVLMDGNGHIIGPRAYSRPRSAAAAGLLLTALLGAGWQWGGLGAAGDGDREGEPALLAAQAASAAIAASAASAASVASAASAALAASATALAATAASASEVTDSVQAAQAASAAASAHAASAADPVVGAASAAVAAPAAGPAHAEPTLASAVDAGKVAAASAAPPSNATQPPGAATDAARLGRIRPTLSDEERQLARQQAAQLRGEHAPAPAAAAAPAIVYAVVTRPSRQREFAASGLAVMRSTAARLSAPAPEHSELMQQQGEWRAAWWPFASQVDAERARVMLAARGLKAEVVEF